MITRLICFALMGVVSLMGIGDVMAKSTVDIYNETFGSVSSNTDYIGSAENLSNENTNTYITTYSGWKFSKNTTKTCNLQGSSGESHIFCGSADKDLIFSFGDLTNFASITLSFNYSNEATTKGGRSCIVQISGDGGETWSDNILNESFSQEWENVEYVLSENDKYDFAVKFSTTAANPTRLDDIKLMGEVAIGSYKLSSVVTPEEAGTVDLSSKMVKVSSTATATYTANPHYTFQNWTISGEGSTINDAKANPVTITMGTADVVITANFTIDPSADVVYKANGGNGDDFTETLFVDEVSLVQACGFDYEGMNFVGWNTQSDGSGGAYKVGDNITMTASGITLYAQWKEKSIYETIYTSNVTLSTDDGVSANDAKVIISDTEYDALKAGTSSVPGSVVIVVPKGTQTLHVHASSWNKDMVTLLVTHNDSKIEFFDLISDSGISSYSPFTLNNTSPQEYYFALDVSELTEEDAVSLEFSAVQGKRFVVFGVNAEGAEINALAIRHNKTQNDYNVIKNHKFNLNGTSVNDLFKGVVVIDGKKYLQK